MTLYAPRSAPSMASATAAARAALTGVGAASICICSRLVDDFILFVSLLRSVIIAGGRRTNNKLYHHHQLNWTTTEDALDHIYDVCKTSSSRPSQKPLTHFLPPA